MRVAERTGQRVIVSWRGQSECLKRVQAPLEASQGTAARLHCAVTLEGLGAGTEADLALGTERCGAFVRESDSAGGAHLKGWQGVGSIGDRAGGCTRSGGVRFQAALNRGRVGTMRR